MKLNDCITFLKLLGVGEIKISDDEDWVRCRCPLSAFTHFKGRDENPSFGIAVEDKGESSYNCFTCGSGRLWDLVHKMNFTTGIPVRASSFFGQAEIFDVDYGSENLEMTRGYQEDIKIIDYKKLKKVTIPEEVLAKYPLIETTPHIEHKEEIEQYFLGRGILPDLLYDYQVRHNPDRLFIIFPVIDNGVYRLHAKLVNEKTFFYLTPESTGFPEVAQWGRKDLWFGMQFIDIGRRLIVVESETDVLRLRSLGVDNVAASCGPMNKYKAARIQNEIVYLGFDADHTGSKYTAKAMQYWRGKSLYKLNWSIVEVSRYTKVKKIEKKRSANDAGDLETIEQFDYIVENKIALGPIMDVVTPIGGYKEVWK